MQTPFTIPEALERRRPSENGLVFLDSSGEVERWTFGDLYDIAARCGGAWRDLGVQPGDRVGLLGSTTPDLVAATFGAWAAGAVCVPFAVPMRLSNPDDLIDEIRARAQRAGVRIMGMDPRFDLIEGLAGAVEHTVRLPELREEGREIPFAEPAPDDAALIQFTSGSTAFPKGVVLSHWNLLGNGLASVNHVEMTSEDRMVSWLPLYHDFGLIGFTLWPLAADMTTHLMSPETFIASPKRWIEALSTYEGTVTAAPNFAWGLAARALRNADTTYDLSHLRVAANGAEPVDPHTIQDFIEAAEPHGFDPGAMMAVYGLAEGTLGVASPKPSAQPGPRWVDATTLATEGMAKEVEPGSDGGRPLVSVGEAIPGVEIAIRDPETGEFLGEDRVGEVVLRTEWAMQGYWDDPDATAEAFVDGWLRTGDLGLHGPDGLAITGRLKDMIIVAGRNLYPEDAERAAQRVPGVRRGNAVAFGILDRAREGLVVIAETRLSGDEASNVAAQVATEVRRAMRIAIDQVVLLAPGSLPKTPSGKLQRRLTQGLYEAGQLLQQAVATAGRAIGAPEPQAT